MAQENIKASCARRPGRLFIYLLTPLARLRSGEQVKSRVDSPPHSRPGVESNRVPACILRVIDHPERSQVPGDRSPPSPWRILPRPLVVYSLLLPLCFSLSRPNPFKKHLFTFRIFRTVLPTAANETRQRDARTRATSSQIRIRIGRARAMELDSLSTDRCFPVYNFQD